MNNHNYNFHTHSILCDGKNSLEEMAEAALRKNFTALGFSGHSFVKYDNYGMSSENKNTYLTTVKNLKEKYKDTLKIYCGVEHDYYSDEDISDYEYIIGSVHAVKIKDDYIPIYKSADFIQEKINHYFNGDYYKYTDLYFETLSKLVEKTNLDIIGHFDFINQFNSDDRYFSTDDKRYMDKALEALHTLSKKNKPFEINTRVIFKNKLKEPCPSYKFIKEMKNLGCNIMLSSDSHETDSLGYYYNEITEFLKSIGYKSTLIWTEHGLEEIKL